MKLYSLLTSCVFLVILTISKCSRRRDLSLIRTKRASESYDYITDSQTEIYHRDASKETVRNERSAIENSSLPIHHHGKNKTIYHNATQNKMHRNFANITTKLPSSLKNSSHVKLINHTIRNNTFPVYSNITNRKLHKNLTSKITVKNTSRTNNLVTFTKPKQTNNSTLAGRNNVSKHNTSSNNTIKLFTNHTIPKHNGKANVTAVNTTVPLIKTNYTAPQVHETLKDDPLADMYKQLKERSKNQRVEKRFVERTKLDPFEKLKEFFDELDKRSVFDEDKEFQPLVKEKRSQLDDVNRNKSKQTSVPSIKSSGSGSGDTESGNEDDSSGNINTIKVKYSGIHPNKIHSTKHKRIDLYESLLKTKRSIDDDLDFEMSHDDERSYVDGHVTRQSYDSVDDDNDDAESNDSVLPFEGIAEKLATDKMVARENPRAKILKKARKHKYIPDIPLPFNEKHKEYEENTSNDDEDSYSKELKTTNRKTQSGSQINTAIPDQLSTKQGNNSPANVVNEHKQRSKNLKVNSTKNNKNIYSPLKQQSDTVITNSSFGRLNLTKVTVVEKHLKKTKTKQQTKQAKSKSNTIRISKRDVIPDTNPDVDRIMGSDGNVLQDEIFSNSKMQPGSMVNEKMTPKFKRLANSKSPKQFTGIWSGLGTTPEFVPGLIKRDYGSEIENNNRHFEENSKINFIKNDNGVKDEDSDEPSSLTKRDVILQDDDVIDDAPNKLENMEQSESKQIELGSLGSFNMGRSKRSKINSDIRIKHRKNDFKVSKREDKETEVALQPLNQTKNDGKTVYAFDEIKELLPAQKIFHSVGENVLHIPSQSPFKKDVSLAPIFTANHEIRSQVTQPNKGFDIDRELADSMILSGERKNKFPSLEAAKIVYEKNLDVDKYLDNDLGETRSFVPIHLLNNSRKISKAQTSKLRAEEQKQKVNQIKNWFKASTRDENAPISDTMDSEIQAMSDQLAESDSELSKLNSAPYTTGAESAYLAKKLEEKNVPIAISTEDRQKTFEQLKNDILKEQENYKIVLNEQHRQLKEQQIQKQKEEERYKQLENSKEYVSSNNPEAILRQESSSQLSPQNLTLEDQVKQPASIESISQEQEMTLNTTSIPVIVEEHFPPLKNMSIAMTTTIAPVYLSSAVPLLRIAATTPIMIKPVKENDQSTTKIKPVKENDQSNSTSNMIKPVKENDQSTSTSILIKPVKENDKSTSTSNIYKAKSNNNTVNIANNNNLPVSSEISGFMNNTVHSIPVTESVNQNQSVFTASVDHTSSLDHQNTPSSNTTLQSPILTNSNTLSETQVDLTTTTTPSISTPSKVTLIYTTPSPTPFSTTTLNGIEVKSDVHNVTVSEEMVNNLPKNTSSSKELPFPLDIAYQPRVVKVSNKTTELEPRSDGYIGCYIDHLEQGRDLPVRAGIPFVTPNNCMSACKRTGYRYAGLQYGYLCFCGNKYGEYDIVPDDQCNTICSGDGKHTCGGLWRNEIFSTEGAPMDANEGPVPVYIPPKDLERKHTQHDPLIVPKSFIPSAPLPEESYEDRIHTGEDTYQSVQASETDDLKALEQETRAAISKNKFGIMRDIQNLTDDDIINVAKLQKKLDEAAQIDIETTGQNSSSHVTSTTTQSQNSSLDDDRSRDLLTAYVYMHPQNGIENELKKSPVLPLRIEPGTHLFRGEVMLQQSWYDDLANTNTSKFRILTGNVEEALKNIFRNESAFLKAEVLSLREAGQHVPHKTVVDFTLTFKQNESTHTVTHRLFDAVLSSGKLDEMPVFPHTLRVREYLLDPNAQAFIPKVINGEWQIDMSNPIATQKQIEKSNNQMTANTMAETSESESLPNTMNILTTTVIAPATTITPPLPAASFRIPGPLRPNAPPALPIETPQVNNLQDNRISELNKYMQYQQQQPNTVINQVQTQYLQPGPVNQQQNGNLPSKFQGPLNQQKTGNFPSQFQGPQQLQQFKEMSAKQQSLNNQKTLPPGQQKRKVPYILRMFFWKDMLARKKREDIDPKAKVPSKSKIINFNNIIEEPRFTNASISTNSDNKLPRVREKRHQADNWPTSYKKDDEKLSYKVKKPTSFLDRKKRILSENEIEENNSLKTTANMDKDFASILLVPSVKRRRKRQPRSIVRREKKQIMKKELFSDFNTISYVSNERKIDPEKELKRNKREENDF